MENKIIMNWFIQQEHIPLLFARRLSRVYDEWVLPNHGKFNESNIQKCLNKMIWESSCPICKEVTIWCDDIIYQGGATIWHCLMCGYEKKPPDTNPNNPDKNIPVQPIKPYGDGVPM
jgi:ribosomal protein L37AE/L43A